MAILAVFDAKNQDMLPFLVDAEDLERLSKFRWTRIGRYAYRAMSVAETRSKRRRNKSWPLTWEVLQFRGSREQCVDHINQDPTDNRKCNLRICTLRENTLNSKQKLDGNKRKIHSKYKGVTKRQDRWYATITQHGIQRCLGCYVTEKEAALAYDRAAEQIQGEFASLNFPDCTDIPRRIFEKGQARKRRQEGAPTYPGVYRDPRLKGLQYFVQIDGKTVPKKRFASEEAAKNYLIGAGCTPEEKRVKSANARREYYSNNLKVVQYVKNELKPWYVEYRGKSWDDRFFKTKSLAQDHRRQILENLP